MKEKRTNKGTDKPYVVYSLPWSERLKKEKRKEKEGKNKSRHLGFVSSNAFGCPNLVYKI